MTRDEASEEARKAMGLATEIGRLLAGKSPEAQGAALAEVLATWLAGHVIQGHPEATDRVREDMIRVHLEAVRKLIPILSRMQQ